LNGRQTSTSGKGGPGGAAPGRGLDAYRSAPIMVVGRAPAAVAPIVPHLPLAIRARSP